MRTTLKDVAREADVSVMTVSRVIHKKEYIASETREKVEAALKRLKYNPNMNARTLVTKKADFLGLIVPDISNPFFGDLVKAGEGLARKRGYSVILGDSGGDPEVEKSYINAFRSRMCDAIILIAPRVDDMLIRELNKMVPLVLVDRQMPDTDIIQVSLENKDGAFSAVEHLIGLGHKKIAFIKGPENVPNTHRREAGYTEALEKSGIPYDPLYTFQGDFTRETGVLAFDAFATLPEMPSAVFGSNDLMAFGFIQRAREKGYSIPEDFSVVGFDDIYLSALIDPPLTTVKYPIVEMGIEAIRKLFDSLESKASFTMNEQLRHKLIIRKSTKPFSRS